MDINKNQDFVMLFNDKIGDWLRLNNQQKNVLTIMSMNMDYNTNEVFISAPRRKEWADKYGMTVQAFNNALARLMAVKVVVRQGLGQYMVDPAIFSKSAFHERMYNKEQFILKLRIKFDTTDGCSAENDGVESEDL